MKLDETFFFITLGVVMLACGVMMVTTRLKRPTLYTVAENVGICQGCGNVTKVIIRESK